MLVASSSSSSCGTNAWAQAGHLIFFPFAGREPARRTFSQLGQVKLTPLVVAIRHLCSLRITISEAGYQFIRQLRWDARLFRESDLNHSKKRQVVAVSLL